LKGENLEGYLSQKDSEWKGVSLNTVTPFMKEIIDNEESVKLREKKGFYLEELGYDLFSFAVL